MRLSRDNPWDSTIPSRQRRSFTAHVRAWLRWNLKLENIKSRVSWSWIGIYNLVFFFICFKLISIRYWILIWYFFSSDRNSSVEWCVWKIRDQTAPRPWCREKWILFSAICTILKKSVVMKPVLMGKRWVDHQSVDMWSDAELLFSEQTPTELVEALKKSDNLRRMSY